MSLSRPLTFASLGLPLLLLAGAFADAEKDEATVAGLFRTGGLFDAKQYKAVRAAFARDFQRRHAASLRAAYGDDHADLVAWLDARADLRDELYSAIDERHDAVPAALSLFAKLWKTSAKQVEEYPALAVATAVVWDRPANAYDYRHHQLRTKSKMPSGLVEGEGNFDYLVNANAAITAQLKLQPREFLTFVVDNRTPIEERKWAQQFVATQKGTSSWHQSVPYDKGMLETEQNGGKGPGPKLAGFDYSLANIKKQGGVCAQQADFVARVGKSLGQPTVYVSGESSYRGWHAWVMWVSVAKPTKDKEKEGVKFALTSDGRTRGFEKDAFYVGHLRDPQTGKAMTDRDMERRLSVVGMDARLSRQTGLAMRAYERLAVELEFDVKERLAFLEKVWALSPYSESAWRELARLAKEGHLAGQQTFAAAKQAALMKHFSRWPDFIAAVSADLLAVETTPAGRLRHLTPQIVLYEKMMRPDLVCDAQMRAAADLREQKKHKDATTALARVVRKFPTEGRYVPKLLKAYEDVCEDYPAGAPALGGLYLELTPALLRHYKGEPNPFVGQVVKQGTAFFERQKLPKQQAQFRALTAGLKAEK